MKASSTTKNDFVFIVIGILFLLVLWMILRAIEPTILVPSVTAVIKDIFTIITSKEGLLIIYTLIKVIIVVGVSLIISTFLGIAMYKSRKINMVLMPILAVMKGTPVASILILLLIFVKEKFAPSVICMLVIVPIISEGIKSALEQIDKDIIEETKMVTNIDLKVIFSVFLKMKKDTIISLLITCFGLGLKVLVMGEVITQGRNTIGNAIVIAKSASLDYTRVFSWTVILFIIVIIVEKGLMKLIKE